jgi:aryl-alcohol dehydrogenase-like predicted oxidoreductase
MPIKPKLCLGTAQFGLRYGITNVAGKVSEHEVARLLLKIGGAGFRWIDTAQSYGNAEAILGRNLPTGHRLNIINKLSAQPQEVFSAEDVSVWEGRFQLSLQRLGTQTLDSLLLHSTSELRKPGGSYLLDWLLGLRQRNLVKRLGVSIYSAADLQYVNSDLLDLVQLPLSLFDQRLLHDGTVARLRVRGTAIHARSLYLQGLLLSPVVEWPHWVPVGVRAHHQALEALANQKGCLLIDLALGFAQAQQDLEAVVLGICSLDELSDLQKAWSKANPWQNDEWQAWAWHDHDFLDPRCWPSR